MIHFAIVGLGPWGLAALDRAVAAARRRPGLPITMTAVDPQAPGPGVHDPGESELLLLNTIAGQVDSFGAAHFGEPPLPGAMTFLAWARRNGRPDATGDTFLPRALFGRYLRFVFAVLRDAAPADLRLAVVRDEAVRIEPGPGPKVRLRLRAGADIVADRILLCTGHGLAGSGPDAPGPATPAPLRPYPAARVDAEVGTARSVGVDGLGLVAVDVVAALTEGRGGQFRRKAGRLFYRPSGREPLIYPFSRSGIPFSCRPATTFDLATRYEPIHCTPDRLAALERRHGLDLVGDVLPPIFAEMRAGYGLRAVALARGAAAAEELRRRLQTADLEEAAALLERAAPDAAGFRPEELVLAERLTEDPADLRDAFVRRLRHDVAEARKGESGSPFKAGVEMLRVVRHALRAGVEGGRLKPDSAALFRRVAAPRIAQLIVGPPVSRGEEWLALIDAGIIRLDFAQAPEIARNWTRARWRCTVRGAVTASTHLDHIVAGHLEDLPLESGLWRNLHDDGLCSTTRDGGRTSPRIDREGRLIDATGQVVRAVHAFGVPTEGPTYFNHYLPSPRSRAGAFERLGAVIERIVSGASGEIAPRPAHPAAEAPPVLLPARRIARTSETRLRRENRNQKPT